MKEPVPAVPRTQEVTVWWGGYSPWTMVPSLLLCVLLTGAITWGAFEYLDRGSVRLAILSSAGLIWAVQTLRIAHRYFGINYHLTTRRLQFDWGILNKGIRTLFLKDVAAVEVESAGWEEVLGVGRVIFRPSDAKEKAMVWRGVRHYQEVAERVRTLIQKASKD